MSRNRQAQASTFDWPGPVVIDIVLERYRDIADGRARTAIARMQEAALRALFFGQARQVAALRLELIAACAARGVSAERIVRADLAVLLELTQIAAARHRNSPRLKAEICDRLEAASVQLLAPEPGKPAPRQSPAPTAGYALRAAAAIG